MLRGVGWIGAMALLWGCDTAKLNDEEYQTYVIPQGKHQSFSGVREVNDTMLIFTAIFDSSAIYSTQNSANNDDVNKLFGVSDCGLVHHLNSARIGWRWRNDSLHLFSYVYCNGVRTINFITNAKIGDVIYCRIDLKKEQYVFTVNNALKTEKRSCDAGVGMLLYPFFGGDESAPHEIKIKIAYSPQTVN